MDSETTTTRKGFLKRAGVAMAGVLTLTAASRSKAVPNSKQSSAVEAPGAMTRIRPAKGAVQYKA